MDPGIEQQPRTPSPLADYVAGALAGSANIVTGYPFDTYVIYNTPHRVDYFQHLISPPSSPPPQPLPQQPLNSFYLSPFLSHFLQSKSTSTSQYLPLQ